MLRLHLVIILATAGFSHVIDPRINIDWNKVVPVQDIPGFWDNKDVRFAPPPSGPISRVVGGNFAKPGQFPWQAALVLNINGFEGLCGGSVISDTVILTAAHCLVSAESANVILGAYNYTQVEEGQVIMFITRQYFRVHEHYEPRMIEQDVATIICPKFRITTLIQPIPLATDKENLMVGEIATVSGFGRYSDAHHFTSDVIRYASMRVITNFECEQTFGLMIPSQVCVRGSATENFPSACSKFI